MTRRGFIRMFAFGFVAGFCHELNKSDDDKGGGL